MPDWDKKVGYTISKLLNQEICADLEECKRRKVTFDSQRELEIDKANEMSCNGRDFV